MGRCMNTCFSEKRLVVLFFISSCQCKHQGPSIFQEHASKTGVPWERLFYALESLHSVLV